MRRLFQAPCGTTARKKLNMHATYADTHTQDITPTHTLARMYRPHKDMQPRSHVCTWARTHARPHARVHARTHACTDMHAHMHAQTCTHTCMHGHARTHACTDMPHIGIGSQPALLLKLPLPKLPALSNACEHVHVRICVLHVFVFRACMRALRGAVCNTWRRLISSFCRLIDCMCSFRIASSLPRTVSPPPLACSVALRSCWDWAGL